MAISRKQYFDNLKKANPLERNDVHARNRNLAHNIIEEQSIINTSEIVNSKGIQTKVNYYYQILDDKNSAVSIDPVSQISDNLIRYGCIRDLPVIFTEPINFSQEGDDTLKSYAYRGSFATLPDTIFPKRNEYFSYELDGRVYLFRTDAVTIETFRNNPSRVVSFHLETTQGKDFVFDDWSLKDNVIEFKTFIPKFVGTDFKPIVSDEEEADLDKMTHLYNVLKNIYIQAFFSESDNTFYMKYQGFDFETKKYIKLNYSESERKYSHSLFQAKYEDTYYDPLMLHFIKDNGLFDRTKNNLVISPQELFPLEEREYDSSIYKAIEERDIENLRCNYQRIHKIKKISPFHSTVLYDKFIVSYHEIPGINSVSFFPNDLFEQIFSKKEYDRAALSNYISPTQIILEVISLYLNKGELEAIMERLRLIEHETNKLVLSNIFPNHGFYLYPLLAYICSKIIIEKFKK